jgi:RNA polymerase sigma-70 factor, ECF subfamily
VSMGSPEVVLGASAVAASFSGRAQGAQPALIDGAVGMAWVAGGRTRVAWEFTIVEDKVVHIAMLAERDTLDDLDLTVLE